MRVYILEAELAKYRNEFQNRNGGDTEQQEQQGLKIEESDRPSSIDSLEQHREDDKEAVDLLSRDIEGLTVEDDGRISFHGPTSLFQLPSGLAEAANPALPVDNESDGRKERLINNAWRERAFEQLTTIPV
ncbi:hypothetical protein TRV_07236 [Trichophyton verrucosum HKI 0517]|uniref:Uncharacterized protein n=1 Tax=Trichophyton verrucosum (strain HKI 0517) TaxID=663202 RepID=D4DJ70_TRIVH|nr:uncharacterized protein TRV_07236 [Trichophyton verrucosum HKI 0517]EFE38086.1 hypothetical protein TRV_07236 [Trichophyton verrucosum HKI 0517]